MITLFKNFRLVDDTQDILKDLYVLDGMIIEAVESVDQVIEGNRRVLCPAFCDMHVHFREPGYEYKETFQSGVKAAIKGGYTAVNCMGNTKPVCDNQETYDWILKQLHQLPIDVTQVVSITKNLEGKDISHLSTMNQLRFLSDDGQGVQSDLLMYEVMQIAKKQNLRLMLHEENKAFSPFSYRMAEDLMTIRDVYLAKQTQAKVHFCHVSTAESLSVIRQNKKMAPITCEVTPHHLYLHDIDYKVHPPIRTLTDVKAVIKAIIDGTVDVIATDHAPHSPQDKASGSPGLIGLESAFSVCYEALVKTHKISLSHLIQLMSTTPHQLLGYFNKGRLLPGYQADFAVIDLEADYQFNLNEIRSKSHNTPFLNQFFSAKVIQTYRLGKELEDDY